MTKKADLTIVTGMENYFRSPLHLAVDIRDLEIVKVLVEHGCPMSMVDQLDLTPLELSLEIKENDIA